MRLLKLKIKNVASLRGEHLIDFQNIQGMSPLFAITGETGAGKSSILNAIGLALYGQIYKKNVNQTDVVTLGEKDGEIELIFQVGGKNHLAEWKAKVRKQNGEPLKQPLTQRHVYPITGDDFDALRGDPIDSVDRLLNLDFDQFCKCIILNQGEFARFLASSFTERKDILEKLYPGEFLDNLGRELKLQLDSLEREKADLDIKLGELNDWHMSGEELRKERDRLSSEVDLHDGWSKKIEGLEYHFIALASARDKWHENKRRADNIRKDIANTTSLYNCAMSDFGPLNTAYEAMKERIEKERPRLLSLLKKEEALGHLNLNFCNCEKKFQDKELHITKINTSIKDIEVRIKAWSKTHETHKFLHAVDLLKKHREILIKEVELFVEQTTLTKELRPLEERLKELEAQGKEIGRELIFAQDKIKALPDNLKERLQELEARRLCLQKEIEERQKKQIHLQEVHKQIAASDKDLIGLGTRLTSSVESLKEQRQEALALETTLKLQELNSAIEVCIAHAQKDSSESCPVCAQSIFPVRWGELLQSLKLADIDGVKDRYKLLSRSIIQLEEEGRLLEKQISDLKQGKSVKTKELETLQIELKAPVPTAAETDQEREGLQKQVWELESLTKDELRLKADLSRAREAWARSKTQKETHVQLIETKEAALKSLLSETDFLSWPLAQEKIDALKEDLRVLNQYLQSESQGERLAQDLAHSQKDRQAALLELEALKIELTDISEKISKLKEELKPELGDKKAQDLIEDLDREARDLDEKWNRSQKTLKDFELALKDHQARLYSIDEQLKDYDLLFVKGLHAIREGAQDNLSAIKEEICALTQNLRNLQLELLSPSELFTPIKDLLTSEKDSLKEKCNSLRMELASSGQRLLDWEKRQDKIKVLQITREEIMKRLSRLTRLFEVLGKDELRSFVLSLVEENLITQTNEELQKLCQGRYEIVHQTRGVRMSPDFFVLDKFREGGLRKVSTLSGGETFMVSLAMALALAEMTRGQAEIDSLFIDEGFGTLDQDSLEDVLDMLNQIQNRGLMVGVISHIKALTNAIPVNLVLTKKQDGTSSIGIVAN
jgi:exonuclease SbcC